VALIASAQLASWIHATVVSHSICLDHGGWVHQPAAPAGRAPGDRRTCHLSPGAPGEDAHEHCSGGAPLRWRDVVLAAPATLAAAPAVSERPSLLPSRASIPGKVVVYLLAPKTSPPAAAS